MDMNGTNALFAFSAGYVASESRERRQSHRLAGVGNMVNLLDLLALVQRTCKRRLFACAVALAAVLGFAQASPAATNNFSSYYKFTTLNVPGTLTSGPGSTANGINNLGHIVGTYYSTSTIQNGFLDVQGNYTSSPPPAGFPCCGFSGINDGGATVQTANNGATTYGIVITSGTSTSLSVPGYAFNAANGIDDAGDVVGDASNLIGNNDAVGFLYSGGTYTIISYPGSTKTMLWGINNNHQMVGVYCTTFYCNAGTVHAVVYQKGTYTSFDFPGATRTVANGINDFGAFVGSYNDSLGYAHGYIDISGLVYGTIDVPGAQDTVILGINNSGQIVGYYDYGTGTSYPFVASQILTP